MAKHAKTTPIVIVFALAWWACQVGAQSFQVLHTFSGSTGWPPASLDGAQPQNTGVIISGGRLYGTTYYGGTNGNGAVYSLNLDGSNFSVLRTFTQHDPTSNTNSDGENPQGGLAVSGD